MDEIFEVLKPYDGVEVILSPDAIGLPTYTGADELVVMRNGIFHPVEGPGRSLNVEYPVFPAFAESALLLLSASISNSDGSLKEVTHV